MIVVDDGSRDRTRERAVDAGVDAVCTHPRPRGLVAAFKTGTHEALRRGADIVVNMDADGQHDPGFVPRLIRPILDGEADIALGVRPLSTPTDDMTTVRRRGNQIGSWVASRALGLALSDATSGYRAFSREALLRLNILSEFTYTLDTIIDASHQRLSVAEVPVRVIPRTVGESRMTHSVTSYIRRTGSQAAMGLLRRRLPAVFAWLTLDRHLRRGRDDRRSSSSATRQEAGQAAISRRCSPRWCCGSSRSGSSSRRCSPRGSTPRASCSRRPCTRCAGSS